MWEFWRSRLSKGKTRHRKRIGSDDDSPGAARIRAERAASGQPPENSKHVYFRDLIISASDESEGDESEVSDESGGLRRKSMRRKQFVDRQKLIVILVGLPGRGKTFLCNKLMCYLNWLGHDTRHFNVGQYRRKQKPSDEVQDAAFFDRNNPEGMARREQALFFALEEMEAWLSTDAAQIAILDATNSTNQRRSLLRSRFHNKWQYLFIESICNDEEVLEQNYLNKMMYSPDYVNKDSAEARVTRQARGAQALRDFKERIRKYEEAYETITDRSLHYIKLIDMVTGRGHMDVNRISGYIPGKMVFFLMQVCKAGVTRVRKIWLTRHGESEYNTHALLGGNSGLSPTGAAYARLLPDAIIDRIPQTNEGETMPVSVWTSTLKRTIQTAELLPFPKLRWKVLDEIQAGIFDGWTYERIEREHPEEYAMRKRDKLRYRYPSGESYMDVIHRLEPVIIEVERERECVVVVGHQAILRALYGYFTKTPLEEIPRLEMPLHTLIELTPKPDGRMAEERIPFDMIEEKVGHPIQLENRNMSIDLNAPPFPGQPLCAGDRALHKSASAPSLTARRIAAQRATLAAAPKLLPRPASALAIPRLQQAAAADGASTAASSAPESTSSTGSERGSAHPAAPPRLAPRNPLAGASHTDVSASVGVPRTAAALPPLHPVPAQGASPPHAPPSAFGAGRLKGRASY